MRNRRAPGTARRAHVLVTIVMTVICGVWCLPTLGALITSFRTPQDANTTGWWTVFTNPAALGRLTLDGYRQALTGDFKMGQAFFNSIAITVPATVIPVLFAAFAAYALTFMRMPGRNMILGLIVMMLIIPNQITFLPLLKLYVRLGIEGTFAAVWLAQAAYGLPLAIFLTRSFMAEMPKDVIDSAVVDGASHYQIVWRVVIPMSLPGLAAFAIFQFLWVWNDLLVALIFIGPGPNNPLPVALANGQISQGFQQLSAAGMLTVVVPVTVFLALQRYFVRGLIGMH